jgi:hypothetical protein
MKCPSCGAAAPEGALECSACGVIFAKFAEKRKREREEAEAALAAMNVPPPPIVDPHLGRKIGFGVFFFWAAVMGFFIIKETQRKHERRAATLNGPAVVVPSAIAGAVAPPAPVAPAVPGAAALPAHAIVVDMSGQMTTPTGETVTTPTH